MTFLSLTDFEYSQCHSCPCQLRQKLNIINTNVGTQKLLNTEQLQLLRLKY